jgi:hypothetical protein
MEQGAGRSLGQEAGEGRLLARNLPAPFGAGPRGTERGPSVLQEIRDVQVLLGVERNGRWFGFTTAREDVDVVDVFRQDGRQSIVVVVPAADWLFQKP